MWFAGGGTRKLEIGQLRLGFEDPVCYAISRGSSVGMEITLLRILETKNSLRKQGWRCARGGYVLWTGREGGSAGSDQFGCCFAALPMFRKLPPGN